MSAGATPSRLRAVTMSSASSRSAGDWLADMQLEQRGAANRKAQSVSSASAHRMRRAPYKRRPKDDGILRLRADDLFDDLPRTTSAGPEPAPSSTGRARIEYRDLEALPDNLLCVIRGAGRTGSTAPLTI